MPIALAYITGILALFFGASLIEQYQSRRQPYHLFWAAGFLLLSAAMGLWFLRETFGLNEWLFRLWYIVGPTLAAAYLGTGMIFMIASRKIAMAFLGYLAIVTVAAFLMILVADFRSPDDCISGLSAAAAGVKGLECMQPGDTLTRMSFFPSEVRVLTGILNLYGGLAVLAGAIWSLSNLGRRGADSRGSSASPPLGDSASDVAKRTMGVVSRTMKDAGLGMKVLSQNKEFWRGDEGVQLSASTVIMTFGMAIAGLSLTMNSVGGSSTHLLLFLVAMLVVYGGILTRRENFDTLPHNALMETVRLVSPAWVGRLSFAAIPNAIINPVRLVKSKFESSATPVPTAAEPAGPSLMDEFASIQATPDLVFSPVQEESLDEEEPVSATVNEVSPITEVEFEEEAAAEEPVSKTPDEGSSEETDPDEDTTARS